MTITIDEIDEILKDAKAAAQAAVEKQDYNRAVNLYLQILRIAYDPFSAHMMIVLLHRLNKNQEALHFLIKYFLHSDDWEVNNTFGVVYSCMHQYDKAIYRFMRALMHRKEQQIDVLNNNLAVAHSGKGDHETACTYLKQAVLVNPKTAYIWFNLGNEHLELQDHKSAIECYNKAIELEPNTPSYHWNLATAYLADQQYELGWKEFEWRWKQFHTFDGVRKRFNKPLWTGESLKGKKILLYCEQGAGDAIQFIRYLKYIRELGATIYFEWPIQSIRGDLVEVFKSIPVIEQVIDTDEAESLDFHFHQSITSIPFILGHKSKSDIPTTSFYLAGTNPELAPVLASHLWEDYEDKFKIGCVWAGSPLHQNDHLRSMHCKHFKILESLPNTQLFSLQKDCIIRNWPAEHDVKLNDGESKMVDLSHYLFDYNSTAHAISKLDLIITVDTSIAHLAGAMGKDTILIVPFNADWRWGTEDKCDWYGDNFKIIRKSKDSKKGDWSDALDLTKKYILDKYIK